MYTFNVCLICITDKTPHHMMVCLRAAGPQYDGFVGTMTGRELLVMFANLRRSVILRDKIVVQTVLLILLTG